MKVDAATIKDRARQLGADLAGVAPVSRFAEAPEGFHPCDVYPGCRSVVALAMHFPLSTLEGKSTSPYTLVRNMLTVRMDTLTTQLADELEAQGVVAIPIPSAEPYDYWDAERRHGRGILSLKHAAVLAGLGTMGKNTLVINDRFGNMIWLGALLLSAELEPDPLATYNACRDRCRICLDACPQHALDGTTSDQKACRVIVGASTEGGGFVYKCNICRKVCPYRAGIKGA